MAKESIIYKLFGGAKKDDLQIGTTQVEAGGYSDPSLMASLSGIDGLPLQDLSSAVSCATGGEVKLRRLPFDRLQQYEVFRTMASDPTIDSGLKMHITHALAASQDTGKIIEIVSESNEQNDKIVKDLRDTFEAKINADIQRWAYTAGLFGFNPIRVYGEQGKGIELLRSDYYTHPYFVKRFERAGQTVGWSSRWQQTNSGSNGRGMITMMPPWSFVDIRMPQWGCDISREPIRFAGDIFDMANDAYMNEGFVETQDYGASIIKTAYEPWIDLQEAILSLNMSRKKASVVERLIGVQTGKLNPQKAAQYLNTISAQVSKTAKAQAQSSLRRGYVQTVWNHLIPIFSAGQGQLDISTLEGKPDIAYIEDIKFHINRLGSSIGIEPSLLGFGEQMSGGMGDGGFFRVSVMAAMKAQAIRTAVMVFLDRLFEIHVALKYNKVFLENEKPWKIKFHSLNTAIAKEYAAEREQAAAFGTSVTQLMQLINPQLGNVDINEFQHWIFTDLLRVTDEKAEKILKKVDQNEAEQILAQSGGFGEQPFPEGNGEAITESLKETIIQTLAELEAEKYGA